MKRLLFILSLFFLSSNSYAFRLSPMVMSFAPSGRGSTQTVLLENRAKKPVAIEFKITKRKIDINGKENRKEVVSDFVIFPPQLILQPEQKRNVRITWTGPSSIKSELSFRLIATQLPVSLERPTNRPGANVHLKFVLQYVASLYVTPPDAKPDIVLESIHNRGHKFEITLRNKGTMHSLLTGMKFTFHSGKKTYSPSKAVLKKLYSKNLLAGNSLRFAIPNPKNFKASKATTDFSLP